MGHTTWFGNSFSFLTFQVRYAETMDSEPGSWWNGGGRKIQIMGRKFEDRQVCHSAKLKWFQRIFQLDFHFYKYGKLAHVLLRWRYSSWRNYTGNPPKPNNLSPKCVVVPWLKLGIWDWSNWQSWDNTNFIWSYKKFQGQKGVPHPQAFVWKSGNSFLLLSLFTSLDRRPMWPKPNSSKCWKRLWRTTWKENVRNPMSLCCINWVSKVKGYILNISDTHDPEYGETCLNCFFWCLLFFRCDPRYPFLAELKILPQGICWSGNWVGWGATWASSWISTLGP